MVATSIHLPSLANAEPLRKRFTRDQYYWLDENRLLEDGVRYELIDGDVVVQAPEKEPHAGLTMRLLFSLAAAYGMDYVRCRVPIVVSEYTEPQPDITVTTQSSEFYLEQLKTPEAPEVSLVIEVAGRFPDHDTTTKALLYSQGGISDYWALDVAGRSLVVHRDPSPEGYTSVFRVPEDGIISPLSKPGAILKVSDYLP